MKNNLWILVLSAIITTLSACVTINIYFPAAAANKAADKIIDDVWQLKAGEQSDKEPTSGSQPSGSKVDDPKSNTTVPDASVESPSTQ